MCGDLVNECGIKVELDLAQVSELSQERYRLAAELEALQGVGGGGGGGPPRRAGRGGGGAPPPPPPPTFQSRVFPWPPNSMLVSSQLVSAPSWTSSWEHAW